MAELSTNKEAGMTRLEQHVRTSEQLVSALRSLLPDLSEEQLAKVKTNFQDNLGHYGADTAIASLSPHARELAEQQLAAAQPAEGE